MRFGLTVMAAVCLTGALAVGQTRPNLDSLERKSQDAQLALDEGNATSADRAEFQDLRDEVGYLRVKARRGQTVTEREQRDLIVRLDRFTDRMTNRSQAGSWTPTDRGTRSDPRDTDRDRNARYGRSDRTVPAGTELDVRLQTPLTSDNAAVEDRVEATTVADLYQGDTLLIPAGSRLVGQVTAVDRASRTDRKGSLTLEFNRVTVNGRTTDVRATVVQALESEGIKGEIGRIGAGAGVGAIIGGIIGGVKGAITGILIGAGGVLVATEGKDVHLPVGTILRVRFDNAVPLTYH